MTSDMTSDPFRKYPARGDWNPALNAMARIDRAHRRLLLAQATEGEARGLFWDAVNAALDSGVAQAEIVRKTGFSREAIRLNRRPGSGGPLLPPEAFAEPAAPEPGEGWTVGRLRAAIAGLADDVPLVVNVPDFDDDTTVEEYVITDAGYGSIDWGDGFGMEPDTHFGINCDGPARDLRTKPVRIAQPTGEAEA
jgi:uncharacterized protein DUF6225